MHDNHDALHITILHSLPGRLRLSFERPVPMPGAFKALEGIRDCIYTPALNTMLCLYEVGEATEKQMLIRIAGTYAAQTDASMIHVRHAEEEAFALPPSGVLALSSIALDGAITLGGFAVPALNTFTRWLAVGTTLTAVAEHGYTELQTRGTFDPEVMSVAYLINAIGKGNTLQACALAWTLTFGRHLIPRDPRETAWMVTRTGQNVTLTPVALRRKRGLAAGELLGRSLDVMAHKA